MKRYYWGAVIILLVAWGTACAPRQIKPVAAIDPAPLLEKIDTRRMAFEQGLSGTVELAFYGKKRFNGKVYIVAFPDGRFRLEVPGPFGGTHLVMASDNTEILAFYPGDNRAFRSEVDGKSINPHLLFPLPVDPAILPAMIMGVLPANSDLSDAQAHLMDSGEKLLEAAAADRELQYTYLFAKGPQSPLRQVTIRGEGMDVLVRTFHDNGHLPRGFTITLSEGILKGEWDSVTPFKGDGSALWPRLPDSVPVTDLEASP
ncbi:MAG: hypothetical protein RRA15_06050 [bacterium]|nr:hypothetical protein [bacterium]MDT8366036.1 hypothetical protein [bacterium]